MRLWASALVALVACDKVEEEPFEECATVLQTVYAPSQHGTSTGVDTNGDVSFSNVDIPSVWGVVFECDHGKFVVQGSSSHYEKLWHDMKEGARVRLYSNSQFRVRDDRRTFVGFDFKRAVLEPDCKIEAEATND